MNRFLNVCAGCAAVVLLFGGCGEHMDDPEQAITFGPPGSLGAVSQSTSSITLHWTAGIGAGDPTFLGYIIAYNGIEDSVPKTQLGALIESLPPGVTTFDVHSYQSDGPRSDAASISWAPADRLEINAIVVEYFVQEPTRISGFSLGSQTRDPRAMAVEPVTTIVIDQLDCYLLGSSGVIEEPLRLNSAHLYQVGLRTTMFSSVTDSAANLDFPRATFPHDSTFTLTSVPILHNRIYYVRITGDLGSETLYARIHVRVNAAAVFPNRQITINVSLQRVPGVPFADGYGREESAGSSGRKG